MLWIFGSFLVTPCALTSCHVVISKQDSMIRALRYNRCVTGRRPCDENHVVRFGQSAENHSRVWETQSIRLSLTSLQGGASIVNPWLLEEDMERSPPSEYMALHPSITHHRNINPFENKVRYIFIKKCVRLFIEVRKLCLCFRLYLYYSYTTDCQYIFDCRFFLLMFIKSTIYNQDWHSYFLGKAQLIPFKGVIMRNHSLLTSEERHLFLSVKITTLLKN